MGDLLEISMIHQCRVFLEKNSDSRQRDYFTAYVQLPDSEQFIIDDMILPRLRRRLADVIHALHPDSTGAVSERFLWVGKEVSKASGHAGRVSQ